MRGKVNWKQVLAGTFVALVAIPLAFAVIYLSWDAYESYRARHLSLTVTGQVRVWGHPDPDPHEGARVIAVPEPGAEVKVLRAQGGADWSSIGVRLADGREGYVDAFGGDRGTTLSGEAVRFRRGVSLWG